jgi:hypothetical protein
MRQAIVTKYLGPTNHRGARIQAKAQAGRRTYSWDHGLDVNQNHTLAAQMFAAEYGWDKHGKMYGGAMPDGTGNVYVIPDGEL